MSSNVIVCIAIDRLLTVTSALHHNPECANRRMNKLLASAWITALLISAPQFAIWKDYIAFEDIKWSQCMQVVLIKKFKKKIRFGKLLEQKLITKIIPSLMKTN